MTPERGPILPCRNRSAAILDIHVTAEWAGRIRWPVDSEGS